MIDITPERLAKVKAAAQKATRGPWRVERGHIEAGQYDEVIVPGQVSCMSYCYGGTSTIDGDNVEADFAHIANADPDLTLALIDLVERSREAEAKLRHLHGPDGDPETNSLSTCGVCTTWEGKAVRWPCPTIQTLDSIQETA